MLVRLSFVLFLASSALSQTVQDGQCDGAIPAQVNFVPTMFTGTWHQIERVNNDNEFGECASTTFDLATDNTFTVTNREVFNLTEIFRNGTATRVDTTGRYIVTYPAVNQNYPYWILYTDYESTALVYTCINLTGATRAVYAWKFSRSTSLSAAQFSQINSVVSLYPALNDAVFRVTSHATEACRTNGANILQSTYIILVAAMFGFCKKLF